jgi:hypothetical protein
LSARILAGAIAGGVVGALALGVFIALGLVLDDRVMSPVPVIVLAIAGAYTAWLLGVIVFGAVRGTDEQESPP